MLSQLCKMTLRAAGVAGVFVLTYVSIFNPMSSDAGEVGELVLVEDGVSKAPIVIFADAPPKTRRAADELAEYIEKTSGARPELIEGEPDPIPPSAVWVGYQPAMDSLFPDLDFDFQHPEEILIAANENHLAILGRDVWNPNHLVVEFSRRTVHGVQQEYGTINAVYTFLQDWLDVRWLWPGELGIDVIERDRIAFEPFEFRYHPTIRARSGLLRFSATAGSGYGISYDWTRLQRLQLGSLSIPGGHAFGSWWNRFHEDHPEYFALQPDGSRGGENPFPSAGNVKLCKSNPAVWDEWLRDVEAQLEEDPLQQTFNAAFNDGGSSGFCICEDCRAWDHPDAPLRRFRWRGLVQEYVALSDRHVTFVNKVARKLKEKYPDEDYYALMLGYGNTRSAPLEAVPDDNVIINMVTGFWGFDGPDKASLIGTTHGEQMAGWAEVTKNLAWRPNSGSPGGFFQGLPDVPLTKMIENFQFLAECNIIGIYVDSVWEHWATQGPLYYVLAQLTWDPSKDGHAVLEDYYRRGFGPAADEIREYWELMEETRNAFVDKSGSWRVRAHYDELPEFYDDDLFARAEEILDRAANQTTDVPEIYSQRVAFVRAGLDYTRLAVEGRVMIDRYEESGEQDMQAKEKARAKWEEIDKLRQEHPLALNWSSLGGNRSPMQADFLPSISTRWR